jgi:hypothetical protein
MTTDTIVASPLEAGRRFLTGWAEQLGTETPVSIRQIAALPGASDLMPTADLRELGTWLWRNRATIPGFRVRRIRRGVSQRKPRGAAGYFWRPAIWTLEVVEPQVSR